MRIDKVATRELFRRSGRKIATWSKANGFDTPRMHHVVSGNVEPTAEEMNALVRDGLVVFSTENDKAA